MTSARGEHDNPAPTRPSTGWVWLSAAWAVALVSTFAALFIGEVMGMTPCQLCWYQRILMFPLAVILGMAAFGNDTRGAIYALPLALAGAAVAGYHTALVAG
jgi:disulfide bond formation protein DsbB